MKLNILDNFKHEISEQFRVVTQLIENKKVSLF